MEHVRWSTRPPLHRPVLVAAFEGWNDAGDAASMAGRWLRDRWAPEPMAEIDAEEFFDFTATRPNVVLEDGTTRSIEWPSTSLTFGALPGGTPAVVLLGIEPQLRWRTFCDQVVAVAHHLDVRLVLTLGALLAEVPHTRPTSVIGTAADQEVIDRLALRRSAYEGPTGIVGVLQDRCTAAGVPAASLWAAVPAYVPGAPSPKAALALVERAAEVLEVPVTTTDLEIAAAAYERQVSEVVVDDDDMREYVARLEERFAEEEAEEEARDEALSSASNFVDEVEQFLREQDDR
jgi:proteasome assembly chaperone (PAC2) family protein